MYTLADMQKDSDRALELFWRRKMDYILSRLQKFEKHYSILLIVGLPLVARVMS